MKNTDSLRREVGNRVRLVRGDRTQEEFAALIGVTRANLASVESGRSFPGPEFLVYIAHRCRVSLNWVLLGEDNTDRESQRPISLDDGFDDDDDLATLLSALWDMAREADDETRIWMKVQLNRAFPELADLADTKKQHSAAAEGA